ncbi:MAG: type II secretion system F family protein [Candidatus Omnitrophica bacterium]|nr:type II secretion system F family protein [Candidatus Omnitrophota bacterium]MCM8807371.1 type II secretion system F family protein [Candidatus Omnitrophota bacterium]
MPVFSYILLDKKGKIIKGKKESEDIDVLKNEFRKEGFYIVKIKEVRNLNFHFLNRIKTEDLIVTIRELSTFLNSGISLDEGLTALISQMRDGYLKSVFINIQRSVREGASFSQALKKHPNLFSEMIISMVRVGEETGNLDLVLSRISDFLEKRQTFRNRIKTIMTYPVFMIIVAFFVILFIFSVIIPTITRVFTEVSLNLPFVTKMLILIARFLKSFWVYIILFAFLIFYLTKNYTKTIKGKLLIEKIIWRIPVLKDFYLKKEIINFSKTLATLIKGGVEILESLNIAKDVLSSINIKREIEEIIEYVSKGGSLSSGFSKSKYFPYLFGQLVGAGERSGNLAEMLDRIGDIYEEDLSQRSTRFVSFLEPFMILFMGGIIGFIVISVLLPIFQISQSIK